MQTEVFLLHDSSQRKAIEQLGELLPNVGVSVLAQALVVETVDLRGGELAEEAAHRVI